MWTVSMLRTHPQLMAPLALFSYFRAQSFKTRSIRPAISSSECILPQAFHLIAPPMNCMGLVIDVEVMFRNSSDN